MSEGGLMASQAKVIIKGQNNIGSAVRSASADLNSMRAAADKLGKVLKSALGATAVIATVRKLGQAVAGCFNDYEDAERKYRQISIALGSGEAFGKVSDTIATLSRQTLESKDSLESMAGELAALGRSADEIDRIASASVYLSNVTGKDLNSSMTTLLGTYSGTTTQLKRLGIDLSDLSSEELENGAAVDRVIESLRVYSEELSKTDTRQHLTNIRNAWGDIGQSVGDLVNFSFAPLIAEFDDAVTQMQERFDDRIQTTKAVLSNLPEFIGRLGETISSMAGRFFSYDNVKGIVRWLGENIPRAFGAMLGNLSNLLGLFLQSIPNAAAAVGKGILSYGMYLVTSFCDETGKDLAGLVNSAGEWLTSSGLGKIVDTLVTGLVNGIRLAAATIRNIPALVDVTASNIGTIAGNLAMDVKNGFLGALSDLVTSVGETLVRINIAQRVEDLRTDFSNLFGRISSWMEAVGLTAEDVFRYIGEMLGAVFDWDNLKGIATTLFQNIGRVASATFGAMFDAVPEMLSGLGGGIGKWLEYLAVSLKDSFLTAIEEMVRTAGEKLRGTWAGKLFGFGEGMASIDLGIDTTKAENLREEAQRSFSGIGSALSEAVGGAVRAAAEAGEDIKASLDIFSGIRPVAIAPLEYQDKESRMVSDPVAERLLGIADRIAGYIDESPGEWKDIGGLLSAAMDPAFERYASGTESIGKMLAEWKPLPPEAYLSSSKEAFSSVPGILSDWGSRFIGDGLEGMEGLWKELSASATDVFGDDVEAFRKWFDGFVSENAEKIGKGVESAGKAAGGLTKALKEKTFLEKAGAWIGSKASAATGSTESQGSAFGGSVVSSLTSSLGEAGNKISGLASNMASMGPVLGAIATALQYVAEGFGEVMGGVLDTFLEYGLEPLRELGRVVGTLVVPLFDALSPILSGIERASEALFNSIGGMLLPVIRSVASTLSVLEPVIGVVLNAVSLLGGLFQSLGTVLSSVFQPVIETMGNMLQSQLQPILGMVTAMLEVLTPVLKVFAKGVVTVTGTIQYVCQTFHHWIASFMNAIASVKIFGHHPFKRLGMEDPGSPGSYQGFMRKQWSAIDDAFSGIRSVTGTDLTSAASTASTSTTVSSAGYQGGTQVTINIYQEAPVVGDGGMKAFARMIRNQFEELDYYGVT